MASVTTAKPFKRISIQSTSIIASPVRFIDPNPVKVNATFNKLKKNKQNKRLWINW